LKNAKYNLFIIIVLLVMPIFTVPKMHSVYYICFFCYLDDDRNHNRNDFLISETKVDAKSN